MPILHLKRLELLQLNSAEVGNDLLLGKLAIALRRLRRKLMRVIKPCTEVFGDGYLGRLNQSPVMRLVQKPRQPLSAS